MTIEQQLQRIKEVGLMALKGLSDEEIALKIKDSVYRVGEMRKSLGILKFRYGIDITKEWKKTSMPSTTNRHYLSFSLTPMQLKEIGINSTDEPLQFTAKIKDKTLILKFRKSQDIIE